MRALPLLIAFCMLAVPVGAVAIAPGAGSSGDAGVLDAGDAANTATVSTDAPIRVNEDEEANESESPRYRVLMVPDEQRRQSGVGQLGADVGPALDLEVDETTARVETTAMRNHVEAAATNDERQRRIIGAVSEIEQAEVTLHERHRTAIQQHANGELSDRELVNELADIAVEARLLQEKLVVLEQLVSETEGFDRGSQIKAIELRLQTYDGPVRSYAVDIARGDRPSDRFYVESGDDAIVLTVVRDGEYVRESFDVGRWSRDGSTFATADDGISVTEREYPETWEARSEAQSYDFAGISRVDVRFPDGALRTFSSAGSDRVFKEHKVRQLGTFEHEETSQRTRDGLNVTVHTSYRGAPVRIVVRDEESGAPVRGVTVRIGVGDDSQIVGQTNASGVLWTVSPSEPFHVTAVGDDAVVPFESLKPTEPATVALDSNDSDE